MMSPIKQPPLCRYCGGTIRKRTEMLFCFPEAPPTESKPDKYTGAILKLAVPRHRVGVFHTKAELQRVTNDQIVSITRHHADKTIISAASTWNGSSYIDEYFCSGDHAKRFAYVMAREGHQTKAHAAKAAKKVKA